MDFIRVGETLLRSPQPLLPFLAPAVYRSGRPRSPLSPGQQTSLQSHTRRQFTSRPSFQQDATAGAKPESRSEMQQQQQQQQQPPSTPAINSEFSDLLDSVLTQEKGSPVAPTGRTSRFQSPAAQERNSPSRLEMRRQQREHNAPENEQSGALAELMNLFSNGPSRRQGQQSSPPGGTQTRPPPPGSRNRIDVDAMLNPLRSGGGGTAAPRSLTGPPPPPAIPQMAPMKLDSTVGRTIPVEATRGMDIARAFRTLEIQCARNGVRRDSTRQRFHERPGLKRKRLKRERWRRRFKENFKATVAMVQRMKAQGW